MGEIENGPDLRALAANISSQIKILGGPNDSLERYLPELDLISADESETFTFEEFKKLICEARIAKKEFLIARVTTADPKDNNLFFNYYYSAFEINKILFKYESSRKLLHRVKVKNPLNNMCIAGQVSYYKITGKSFDKSLVDYFFKDKEATRKKGRRAFSTIIRNSEVKNIHHDIDATRSKDTCDLKNRIETYNEPQKNPTDTLNDVKNGLIFIPTTEKANEKIVYEAVYFGCDDDFLFKSEIRDYFKRNSIENDEALLFDLERTDDDLFALLESETESESDESAGWKRVLTAHMSILMSTLCVIILFGANPIVLAAAFGVALVVFFSLLCSMAYLMCCRREAFDTLAVRSVDDV